MNTIVNGKDLVSVVGHLQFLAESYPKSVNSNLLSFAKGLLRQRVSVIGLVATQDEVNWVEVPKFMDNKLCGIHPIETCALFARITMGVNTAELVARRTAKAAKRKTNRVVVLSSTSRTQTVKVKAVA